MKTQLTADFFAGNRERLLESLKGGVIALSAYSEMQRGNDIAHHFEQESNFWYLTGIEKPNWWVIGDSSRRKWWLVAPEVSDITAAFDGSLSPKEATARSGIVEVIDRNAALTLLRQLRRSHSLAYTCDQASYLEQYYNFMLNPAPKEMRELLARNFNKVQSCRRELLRLRAIKQPEEIACIKTAVQATIEAFAEVKKSMLSYKAEYEIEADFWHSFRRRGMAHAYGPIIGSAGNASTLHYEANSDALKKRTLVLMDVGAKYEGYCADISRTYAYGEPTKRQQQVHKAVVAAHEDIIGYCQPGVSIERYLEKADQRMADALRSVGLLDAFDEKQFRRYFPHAIGHGLGIDPHDSLGGYTELQPGMVMTIEPGIYIADENIGVRIEDDLLVTEKGITNLSAKLGWDY